MGAGVRVLLVHTLECRRLTNRVWAVLCFASNTSVPDCFCLVNDASSCWMVILGTPVRALSSDAAVCLSVCCCQVAYAICEKYARLCHPT